MFGAIAGGIASALAGCAMSKVFGGVFFFSSRRRHTRWTGDWSSDVCSSDLSPPGELLAGQGSEGIGRGAGMIVSVAPPGGESQRFRYANLLCTTPLAVSAGAVEIGRASVGKECRSRWWTSQ